MIALAKNEEHKTVDWQDGFLKLLPTIERHARIAFRGMKTEAKDEAVASVVAAACTAYQRLHERGELDRAFAGALAHYAVAQYHSGRRVGTAQNSGDLLSPTRRNVFGHEIHSLSVTESGCEELVDGLIDRRTTPVADQAALRIDFPRWFSTQSIRNQKILNRLSQSYSTSEVAREFRISPGRISQLRREFANSWQEFHAPPGKGAEIGHKHNNQPYNIKELCNA